MPTEERAPIVGAQAPNFKLPATGLEDRETLQLSSLLDNRIVLFFYPKDDTPGCTKEAMEFSAFMDEFKTAGITVIGMSPDPVKKHKKFIDKHSLSIQLVSDEEKSTLAAYGVWVEKQMYGKKYMGVERSTFLIGKDRTVLKAWRKVKVPGHVEAVLAAARELA